MRVKYDPMFRFLCRKPRILLAFAHMSLMWLSHFKTSVMATPRYLAYVTLARVWLCNLYFAGVVVSICQ